MQSWLHCNKCLSKPSSENSTFFINSCGHIFCEKCIVVTNKNDTFAGVDTIRDGGGTRPCFVCQKHVSSMRISRSMRGDLLEMFKPPSEIFAGSTQRTKVALEFQSMHHQRFLRGLQEKQQKYVACAQHLQSELHKRAAVERTLLRERDDFKAQLGETRGTVAELQRIISARESELHSLRLKHQRIRQQNFYTHQTFQKTPDLRGSATRRNSGHSFITESGGGSKLRRVESGHQSNFQFNIEFSRSGKTPNLPGDPRSDLRLQNLLNTPTNSSNIVTTTLNDRALPFKDTPALFGFSRTTDVDAPDEYF